MEEQEIKHRIAENIRMARAKKKFSQEFVAEQANISTKYMNSIENEKANPSITIIVNICEVLEMELNKLLSQ